MTPGKATGVQAESRDAEIPSRSVLTIPIPALPRLAWMAAMILPRLHLLHGTFYWFSVTAQSLYPPAVFRSATMPALFLPPGSASSLGYQIPSILPSFPQRIVCMSTQTRIASRTLTGWSMLRLLCLSSHFLFRPLKTLPTALLTARQGLSVTSTFFANSSSPLTP